MFIFGSPLGLADEIVQKTGRNLYFYGFTIGQFGFGIIVSKKRTQSSGKKKLIIAGTYNQYRQYILEHGLNPTDAVYVSEPYKLRYYRSEEVEIIRVGTWYNNKCVGSPELMVLERKSL